MLLPDMPNYSWWLYACGVAVNVWLAFHLVKIGIHLIWCAASATSVVRFMWRMGTVHGYTSGISKRWLRMPGLWVRTFFDFLGSERGATSITTTGGGWWGIGNWRVYPAKVEFTPDPDLPLDDDFEDDDYPEMEMPLPREMPRSPAPSCDRAFRFDDLDNDECDTPDEAATPRIVIPKYFYY